MFFFQKSGHRVWYAKQCASGILECRCGIQAIRSRPKGPCLHNLSPRLAPSFPSFCYNSLSLNSLFYQNHVISQQITLLRRLLDEKRWEINQIYQFFFAIPKGFHL